MYAIIESGGKQYRVAEGDVIQVERLPIEEGKKVTIDRVLMSHARCSSRLQDSRDVSLQFDPKIGHKTLLKPIYLQKLA